MTKVQVWVEIPDGFELACDMLRIPIEGEQFVANDGKVSIAHDDHALPRVIVRPTWKWPSWLKAAAIVRVRYGEWIAHESIPAFDDVYQVWKSDGRYFTIMPSLMDFTPPPCTDWRTSLRLNPNREAK